MKRLATPLAALAVFLSNVWLNWPLFLPGELPFRGSIEGGYAGMAHFISAHPNPWGWNPLPYCGLPTQFMYVPGLLYLTALAVHLLPHAPPEYVYRVLAATATCVGPVTLFFFALYFTGSRRWALLASLGYSFLSPSYGLFPQVEKDRGIVQLPWRIQVLAKYGEGPHNTGLMLMPLVLLAAWEAGKRRGYAPIFVAAVLFAAVPLTNWVAALSLAIASVLLLFATLGEPDFLAWRVLAAVGLAYLLACFWLTPSFIGTIVFNWPIDSFAYHFLGAQQLLVAGLVASVVLIRLIFHWLRGSFYFCFVTLCAFVFGWIATGFYVYGMDTIPESRRYALEFEFFLALALAEAFRLTWRNPNPTVRLCAIGAAGAMLLVGSSQLWAYATQGWERWKPQPRENTIEFRLAQWLAAQHPQGRIFASGGLRFRLNSWFELPQVGGGFETGLRNRVPVDLAYAIRSGRKDAILQLQALGVQYVVVHGPKSREYYRDFQHPEQLAAALPAVHHEEDDTIYELPGSALAHVGDLPLRTRWVGTSELTVDGPMPAESAVGVRVNYDPGWTADIPIMQDSMGFMVLRPATAVSHILLRYRGTSEQRVMAALSGMTWIAALAGLLWRKRSASTTTN